MGDFLHQDNQIAGDAAARGCIAFAAHGELHAVIDTGGDVDGDDLLGTDDALAVAVVALVLDDAPFAAAMGADALGLHLAQQGAAHFGHHTCSVTVGTDVVVVVAGSRAATGLAGHIFGHFYLLFAAFVNLLECELHLDAQIASTHGGATMPLLPTAKTSESRETATAEEIAEQVAEMREYVVHIHVAGATSLEGSVAELVVFCLFVRVAQHIVGLSSLLELLLSLFVAGIAVGMVLQGQFAVGFLQLIGSGVLAHSKHFVVISLCHSFKVFRFCITCCGKKRLDGHHHLGVAQHLGVEVVALFHHIDDGAFLAFLGCGELGDGLVEVLVEFGSLGLDGRKAFLRKDVHQFVVNQLNALFCAVVVGHRGEGSFHIVHHGQDGFNHVLAAADDEVGFLGIGALAVVLVLGIEAYILVVHLGKLLPHFLHFLLMITVAVMTFATLFAGFFLLSLRLLRRGFGLRVGTSLGCHILFFL